ncbi:MAG: nucleotide exchange factor GrpE [Hydrococcus sp. Prado102]|nr:nucleotide exchange factor GrpE [Hydrococcus sp. Prado102]
MSADRAIYLKNHQILHQLMAQVGISSLSELSQLSEISELQLIRLQYGLLPKMQINISIKLSQVLQISVDKLLSLFCSEYSSIEESEPQKASTATDALDTLKQEYQNLQQQLEKQRETLEEAFQQESLQRLESWLLQWPTAAAVAQQNPQLPAMKLLPLMKPITDLLQSWGVEAIASVGEAVPYDPQWHQLMEGNAESGQLVKIRYVGYRQGEKLLYRAKVSPILVTLGEQ